MSYRDELGAAQSRIDALERELKETKDELESRALVVRGPNELAKRPGQVAAKRWLGAQTRYRGERVVEGEINDSVWADIVECCVEGFDNAGRSSTVPGRLDWTTLANNQNGAVSSSTISVTSGKGKTTIRGEVRVGGAAGAIYGGVGAGLGLGGLVAPAALFLVNPLFGIAGVTAWLGGTTWVCRKIFTRMSKKRGDRLEEVLDALEKLITDAPKIDDS